MSEKAYYYFSNMADEFQVEKSDVEDKITKLSSDYWNYKGFYNFPSQYKGYLFIQIEECYHNISFIEYELQRSNLKFVQIKFNAPVFDKITKDRAAKFVDQLSAIGGTMGLLTGFSIISGVEIVYFAVKIAFRYFKDCREKMFKST